MSVLAGWFARVAMVAACSFGLLTACRAREAAQAPMDMSVMDSSDEHASQAAHEAMNGPMATDPHMTLTPLRPPSAADSIRAAALVRELRVALARYRDVRLAEVDGFRQFLPNVKQLVYHFTNRRWALAEMFRFDPAKPTSLLYRPDADGRLVLVGVMYSAPARTSLDELDRRIPLSVGRWHEHVNWCLPPRGHIERWRELRDGAPVFGPKSTIATADQCATVGGRFVPRLFGWMAHVMAFESDDPNVIWGGEPGHRHS